MELKKWKLLWWKSECVLLKDMFFGKVGVWGEIFSMRVRMKVFVFKSWMNMNGFWRGGLVLFFWKILGLILFCVLGFGVWDFGIVRVRVWVLGLVLLSLGLVVDFVMNLENFVFFKGVELIGEWWIVVWVGFYFEWDCLGWNNWRIVFECLGLWIVWFS